MLLVLLLCQGNSARSIKVKMAIAGGFVARTGMSSFCMKRTFLPVEWSQKLTYLSF